MNKLFLNIDKDNCAQVFGYRIRFLPGKKGVFKERSDRPQSDLGLSEIRNVSYRYESLPGYSTKRRLLRPFECQEQLAEDLFGTEHLVVYRKRKTFIRWVYLDAPPVEVMIMPIPHQPPFKSKSLKEPEPTTPGGTTCLSTSFQSTSLRQSNGQILAHIQEKPRASPWAGSALKAKTTP